MDLLTKLGCFNKYYHIFSFYNDTHLNRSFLGFVRTWLLLSKNYFLGLKNEAIALFGLGKIDLEKHEPVANVAFWTKGRTFIASHCTKLPFIILSFYVQFFVQWTFLQKKLWHLNGKLSFILWLDSKSLRTRRILKKLKMFNYIYCG